jgi:hypothetical protein
MHIIIATGEDNSINERYTFSTLKSQMSTAVVQYLLLRIFTEKKNAVHQSTYNIIVFVGNLFEVYRWCDRTLIFAANTR